MTTPTPSPGTAARVLQQLSTLQDETRVRLLLVLAGGEFTVGELCQVLRLPQSTVSRHLKTLADGGWVVARSEGTSRLYRFVVPTDEAERGLWGVVRRAVDGTPGVLEDRERASAVLAERRERSRDFFRTAAGRWDALRVELFGGRIGDLSLAGLLDPGWTVGDLGCGTGALAAALAPWVERVVAVDREPEMLEAASLRLAGSPGVEVRQGDLQALPLEDGELDAAFCVLVLHLVAEPRAVLAEAARVLRPGGVLVVVDMREHHREEFSAEMGHVWTGFSPSILEDWLRGEGYDAVRVVPLPPEPSAKGPPLLLARGRRSPGTHRGG